MSRAEKVRSVEVLRGLAALSVAWFHITLTQSGWLAASGMYGWLGVHVFFVLSGFVIPLSLHASGYQSRMYGDFLLRRAIRIEIPYLASIALVIALHHLSTLAPGFRGTTPDYEPAQILAHIIYVIPFTSHDWLNIVYWTLAYEFAFYLIAGLLFTSLWKRPLAVTALATLVVFGAFALVTRQWDPLIFLFLIGTATFRKYVNRDGWASYATCIAGAGVAMILLGAPLEAAAGIATSLTILFVTFPSFRPLLWLGAVSYSLYLVHVPIGGRIVNLGQRMFEDSWQLFLVSVAALLVSVLAAWLFYRLIERPARDYARRMSRRTQFRNAIPDPAG